MVPSPKITVLLPVHNGEPYLGAALESILCQSCGDFEILVMDDGSTDGSAALVEGYGDRRIRLVRNGTNLGLVATLNRGADLARGEYVARMDCDDLALPERLARQAAHLDANPDCAAVACLVEMIGPDGENAGQWDDDRNTSNRAAIRRFLPRANCIAHPGVMIRRTLLERYRYHQAQYGSEDYDLWLRLTADGMNIDKLPEVLLRYRIVPGSLTAISGRRGPERKNLRTKGIFLRDRFREGRLNPFVARVALGCLRDLFYLVAKGVTFPRGQDRDLLAMELNESLPVRLLAALGKPVGWLLPFRNRSALFLFFPFLHVGGAERVHGAVTGCLADRRPWVFFTKRSENDRFRQLFPAQSRLCNIWFLLKCGYPFSVGIMAGFINRHRNPVVFGSNSLFYYLLLPHLRPGVRRIDLLHAGSGAPARFSLPVASLLDRRVVVTPGIIGNLRARYLDQGLDPALLERVEVIENGVSVPAERPHRDGHDPLIVLFVGRGSPEKRVHLVGRAASRCREMGLPVQFVLVGEVEKALLPKDRESCRLLGEIADPGELIQIYARAAILLITSSREGFPLVIMEAMAHGVVPVSTAVGGIPEHLRHGENGLLLIEGEEEQIVEELVLALRLLCGNRLLLERLSLAAYSYARERFDSRLFCRAYRRILLDMEEE